MKKVIICISCPLGCNIGAEFDDEKVLSVENNRCKKGLHYVRKELFSPERIVTTTVCLINSQMEVVPVKTQRPVPKGIVADVVKAVSALKVSAPVRIGQVMLANVCGSGVDIVATRNADK